MIKKTTILFYILLLFSCSNKSKIIEIYESKDLSQYKTAIELLLQDKKLLETKFGSETMDKLKSGYISYKKILILDKYKDTKYSYIKNDILYIANLDGSNETRIGNYSRGRNFVWSPNGRYIAYDDTFHDDIFIIDTNNGYTKKLTENWGESQTPSWSPDSEKVIYSLYNKIMSINISTMKNEVIKKLEDGYVLYPQYVTNTKIIYFHNSKLYILNTKSDKEKKDNEVTSNTFFIDPNSNNIALSNKKNNVALNSNLVSLIDSSKKIISDEVIYSLSWAPNDDYVMYERYGGDIFLKDLNETLKLDGLDIEINNGITKPSWSPGK